MSIYYVYFYLRSKDSKTAKTGTPYYIGKGKNGRAFDKHGKINIPEKSSILFRHQNLTEIQAFMLERYYIRWFGRKDLGTGILHNKTDGGEGFSGLIYSKERKEKISNKAKERVKLGTHNFLTPKNGKSIQTIRKENGKHPAQSVSNIFKTNNPMKKREDGSSLASERSKNGTHNFLSTKGTVPCINKSGKFVRIDRETYYNQKGIDQEKEWVFNRSKEGTKRINALLHTSCD